MKEVVEQFGMLASSGLQADQEARAPGDGRKDCRGIPEKSDGGKGPRAEEKQGVDHPEG